MQNASGNIKIIQTDDYELMSINAAEIIAKQIMNMPNSVIGFATGSTPLGVYKELIRLHNEDKLDFSGIKTFNLDEYCQIKKDNNQSYYYFMHSNLFNHVNINKKNVNMLDGEADDWRKEVWQYEDKIVKAGGINLQLLGIGSNGHIAFNEPSDEFSGFSTRVRLAENTIKDNSRFFEKEEDVPKFALSMGIRSIMMAQKIVLIANGENKSDVLYKAVNGAITPKLPASVLQLHRDVTIVADKKACQCFLDTNLGGKI